MEGSAIVRSQLHQFVASTNLASGVTATYLGTAPAGITWSIFQVFVSIRYRKLAVVPSPGEQVSLPSRNPGPYME